MPFYTSLMVRYLGTRVFHRNIYKEKQEIDSRHTWILDFIHHKIWLQHNFLEPVRHFTSYIQHYSSMQSFQQKFLLCHYILPVIYYKHAEFVSNIKFFQQRRVVNLKLQSSSPELTSPSDGTNYQRSGNNPRKARCSEKITQFHFMPQYKGTHSSLTSCSLVYNAWTFNSIHGQ